MKKLIEKHQQKNKGKGVINFSPSYVAELELMMNPNKQRSDTVERTTQQLLIKKQVASKNTPEQIKLRKRAVQMKNFEKNQKEAEKTYRTAQQYKQAQEDAATDTKWNPRAWISDTSKVPLFGLPATIAKALYAGGNYLTGNEGAAKYWWEDANRDAIGQTIGLGGIAAHMNPVGYVTGPMFDASLLGEYMRDLDQLGKLQHYERLTGEDTGNLTLASIPFLSTRFRFENPGLLRLLMDKIDTSVSSNGGGLNIPLGYEFIRPLSLRTKDGVRNVHLVRNTSTGKFYILEDLKTQLPSIQKEIDLSKYNGLKLTGNEPGFDAWARKLTPENDHFPDLSHGLQDTRELSSIINREFDSLPNGSRVDLGEIFSGDISSNLLLYIYRNKDRIKMILPEFDDMVQTNSHGIKGARSADLFNYQLERLLDHYGYSPSAVPKAVYNSETNRLTVPKLSFIKLHRKGNKLIKKWN